MTKQKMFTHTDLDGVACALVADHMETNLDVSYCTYADIDTAIMNFIRFEMHLYHRVIVTDISVKEQTAEEMQRINNEKGYEFFVLLDHHEDALPLNRFPFANVITSYEGLNMSGVSLLYMYYNQPQECLPFVELVRSYDTYDWFYVKQNEQAKSLNDLFWIYGIDKFFNEKKDIFKTGQIFNEKEQFMLEIERQRIEQYIKKTLKSFRVIQVGTFKVGVVYADMYLSEVGNKVHLERNDVDLIAVVNMKSGRVSYRTTRTDINVNEVANLFGGGGRPQTAGSQIDRNLMTEMTQGIFRA